MSSFLAAHQHISNLVVIGQKLTRNHRRSAERSVAGTCCRSMLYTRTEILETLSTKIRFVSIGCDVLGCIYRCIYHKLFKVRNFPQAITRYLAANFFKPVILLLLPLQCFL